MNTINRRLEDLRQVMRTEKLDAFIFPSTDPHQGEYVPDHWKGREWISGFNGSAGTAVVTMNEAALWTDSRYFIAANEQLKGTEFVLMKERISGTPTISQWLGRMLQNVKSPQVGIDGTVCSATAVIQLVTELRHEGGITLRTNFDPLKLIWNDRPSLPLSPVYVQPLQYAGESAQSKLHRIRKALRQQHADGMLMCALDDIAWTLNLRGDDVHCNPVFVSYLLISSQKATLFVNPDKLTDEVKGYLHNEGVETDDYNNIVKGLKSYPDYNILLDENETNYTLAKAVECEKVMGESPVKRMKTVKNEAEIAGFRQAMLKDGIAMVKFLRWLQPAVEAGGLTEMGVDRKLTSLRAEQPLFHGISFDTISSYQSHGAIVHYEATPATDSPLRPEGLLLLDSGAQYVDGTTDITRTIALGELSDEQRHIYTLVLKGHLQLQNAIFPSHASGTQIDALARKDMWREGYNYLHGTGHGVGSFLNVHEGPHQIRMEYKPAPLLPGMTVTDEPGIYIEGRFGVRIENVLLIKPYATTPFGQFLQFEPLTLCPIDTKPIVMEMMTNDELQWLNQYHQMVFDCLAPHLDEQHREWLRSATKPLNKP